MPQPSAHLAYLVSQYPAISHTFILREIQQLRQLGFTIRTASIKSPAPSPSGFTEVESSETAATFYVKARSPVDLLGDHAACLLRNPLAYFAGLLAALRMAGLDLKAILYHLLYFSQGVV